MFNQEYPILFTGIITNYNSIPDTGNLSYYKNHGGMIYHNKADDISFVVKVISKVPEEIKKKITIMAFSLDIYHLLNLR